MVGTVQLTFIPGLSRRGALRGQIEAVRIAGDRRGSGHGEALFKWAIYQCRQRGCAIVQLTTDKARTDAHRFYERLGFEPSHIGYKLKLGEEVDHLGIRGDRFEQQGAVAMRGLALEAQQRARLFRRQLEHLRGLRHRFGQLELAGIDALQVRVPPGRAAARPSAGVPSAFRWTYSIPASSSAPRAASWRNPGRRDSGSARTSITRSTPQLQRGEELVDRRALIADGEDAHASPVIASSKREQSSRALDCFASLAMTAPCPSTSTSSAAASPGREAAWQLAEAGLRVRLSEMRGGGDTTPAHETDRLAEMVCSNSFRSDDAEHNAVGLLHQEMRALGSLIMRAADAAPRSRRLGAGRRPRGVRRRGHARDRAAIPTSPSSASGSTPCPTIRRSSPPAR